jgi:hypothetical protein
MSERLNVVKNLIARRERIRDWISEEAGHTLTDQRHLVENATERDYWHHGYMAALDDVIALIDSGSREGDSADKPN